MIWLGTPGKRWRHLGLTVKLMELLSRQQDVNSRIGNGDETVVCGAFRALFPVALKHQAFRGKNGNRQPKSYQHTAKMIKNKVAKARDQLFLWKARLLHPVSRFRTALTPKMSQRDAKSSLRRTLRH